MQPQYAYTFCGRQWYFVSGGARLAEVCGVPLIPVGVREEKGFKWTVVFGAPLKGRDFRSNMQEALLFLEESVRKAPWLWYAADVALDYKAEEPDNNAFL